MAKKFGVAAAIAVLIVVLGLPVTERSSPAGFAKGYFAVARLFPHGVRPPFHVRRLFGPVPVWKEIEPGVHMLLDPYDLVSREILTHRTYEEETLAVIKRHLPPGGTFVDVGAHIGIHSLRAARVVGSKGHVIAIEPNPKTLEKLRDNIRRSGASVISVQPVACSDSETELDFFASLRDNTGESSLSRENAQHSGGVSAVYRVRARPLDAIIEESGVSRVDAIKIDVEGAELLVLKGAKQTLARFGPIVVVEMIDRQLRALGASEAALREFLRPQGYTPRRVLDRWNIEFER